MSSLKENWLITFHSGCSWKQQESFPIPLQYGNSGELLADRGVDMEIWKVSRQKQLDAMKLKVKKGIM